MKRKGVTLLGVLALVVCSQARASVRVRVTDRTGAPFPDVLVIVKSLAGKGEIFRALTNQTGRVPDRDLAAGLYRVIATCPYGICETKITEFLVGDAPVELELKVDVSPTRGNVTVVGPSNRMRVQLLDPQGKPVASAEVLVRDSSAEFERWYKTNSDGEADVEPLGTKITFAVLYKRTLTEETVSAASIEKLRTEGKKLVIRLR